jgi:hypothetical protein
LQSLPFSHHYYLLSPSLSLSFFLSLSLLAEKVAWTDAEKIILESTLGMMVSPSPCMIHSIIGPVREREREIGMLWYGYDSQSGNVFFVSWHLSHQLSLSLSLYFSKKRARRFKSLFSLTLSLLPLSPIPKWKREREREREREEERERKKKER